MKRTASNIAIPYDRTIYDSLYVALAVKTDSKMITADKQPSNVLAGSPLEKYVMGLGDVESLIVRCL